MFPTPPLRAGHGVLCALFMLAANSLTAAPAPSQPESLFTAQDVFGLEIATDPQVSPDGSRVAYVRVTMNIMTDKAERSIWVINTDGGHHQPLVTGPGDYSSPRWSPSGKRLAYLGKNEGKTQLMVRWLDSNAEVQITDLPNAPSGIVWSSSGEHIAFTRLVPAPAATLGEMPKKPEGAQWAAPPVVVDRMVYRRDGAGYLPTGTRHLFVVPAEGGSPRQLTEGDYPMGSTVSWTRDGSSIIFSANRRDDHPYHPRESDLFQVSVEDRTLTQLTDAPGAESAPMTSPSGDFLAYRKTADIRRGYNPAQVAILDRRSGQHRLLTEDFDRSVDKVQWATASDALWLQYDDRGVARLARMNLQGDRQQANIALGGVGIGRPYTSGSFSVGGDDVIVATQGQDDKPADLALVRKDKDPLALTHLNDDLFGYKSLSTTEPLTWSSSHDGQTIAGWVMKPPGFDPDQTYPMILEIHGGPHTAYGPNFSVEAQLYAAAGYVVLYTNPRGSTSYGEKFANEIDLAYPGHDYDDLMSGVDALLAQGYVDHEQLFVTGGSGGGVLTAWIVGKTDRFKAAVVAKPVINWASFVLTADLNYYFATTWFESPPWEDIESYWQRSPLSLVGNVSTPTLLLTGEVDYRTPMSETEQYYQALKHRGIDTLMVRIPGASHSIYKRPSNQIAKVNSILAWFERYRP